MSLSLKCIFAFIIDWFLTGIFLMISTLILYMLSEIPGIIGNVFLIIMFLSAFGMLFVFFFRDAVFMGRTPGKKLFCLGVYDADTLEAPLQKKLFIKGLFTILFQIDGIILLIAKKSLGEVASNTAVLDEVSLENLKAQRRNPAPYMAPHGFGQYAPQPSQKSKWKTPLLIVGAVVLMGAMIFGLVHMILRSKKDNEEHKLAYSYLVESKSFKDFGADESDIRMNQYSSNTYVSNTGEKTKTVTIGFIVNFRTFEVVCHFEDDEWQVCSECTEFE